MLQNSELFSNFLHLEYVSDFAMAPDLFVRTIYTTTSQLLLPLSSVIIGELLPNLSNSLLRLSSSFSKDKTYLYFQTYLPQTKDRFFLLSVDRVTVPLPKYILNYFLALSRQRNLNPAHLQLS